jgi:hypothetical protein
MDIYISNDEDKIEDELITYLEEKRIDKKVSKIHFKFIKEILIIPLLFLYYYYFIYKY